MSVSNDATDKGMNPDPSAATRWMAGLAVGAVGVGGLAGVDEAYGAIVTLDNGGAGWTLNKPAYSSSAYATVTADIGSPGSAVFGLEWYNDRWGINASVEGISVGASFLRNTASATPGTPSSHRVEVRTSTYGSFTNYAREGNDNWLALQFIDAGINGGVETTGWLQLDNMDPNTMAIIGISYSDSGGTLHLDGEGGMKEIPEPRSLALLAAGAGGLLAFRRRRKAIQPTSTKAAA